MLSRGQVPRSPRSVQGVQRPILTRKAGLREAGCRTQSLPEPRDCPPNPTSSGRVLLGAPLQLHPAGCSWRTDRRTESPASALKGGCVEGPTPLQGPILLSAAAGSVPVPPPGSRSPRLPPLRRPCAHLRSPKRAAPIQAPPAERTVAAQHCEGSVPSQTETCVRPPGPSPQIRGAEQHARTAGSAHVPRRG